MTVLTLLAATIPLAVTVIGEPRGEGPLLSPRLRLAVPTRERTAASKTRESLRSSLSTRSASNAGAALGPSLKNALEVGALDRL